MLQDRTGDPSRDKRLSCRSFRTLSHRDEPIGGSNVHCAIVCAEVVDRTEAALPETGLQLAMRPTSHDELIIAGLFLTISDQGVPFGQDKLSVLSIQVCDARERQLAPVSVDTFLEDRLPSLARGGGLPLSHVQDQHAGQVEAPGRTSQERLRGPRHRGSH